MDSQPDLFSALEEGPDARWIREVVVVIRALALTRDAMTSRDVWDLLTVQPTEKRAMGAAMRAAKKRGYIHPTGYYEPSGSHGRPIAVWKSNIYRSAA